MGGNLNMSISRTHFGSDLSCQPRNWVRRAATAIGTAVLAGALTFTGVPLAVAEQAADPTSTVETTSTEADKAGDARPEPAEPKQAEPKQAEPKQAEPKQAEPKQAEPKQAEPKQAEQEESVAVEPEPADRSAEPVPASEPKSPQETPEKDQLTDAETDTSAVAETESPSGEPTVTPQEKTSKPPAKPITGRLVIVKAILPSGSSNPADAVAGGSGWGFAVSSSSATAAPSSQETGTDSSASFSLTLDEGKTLPARVTVTEVGKKGYHYVKAQCVSPQDNKSVSLTQSAGASFHVDLSAKKTVCVVYNRVDEALVALKVKKTANPAFDRDYDWTIEKTVTNQPTAHIKPGETATFDYQVVATPSTAQDSNFRITGTITIGNPNNVAVPVTVTDDLDIEDATCAINDADGAVVPASGTLTLTYECQLPDGTSPTTVGKNNATVTWNGGHITATTRYAFSSEAATVTDRTVQLSDTAPEFGSTRTLDALDGPQTFTYSRTLGETVTADTCQTFPNTASIAPTTDQPELTDDADVTVCAEDEALVALKVKKTANPAFDRDYDWTIEKTVTNQPTAHIKPGETATFDYQVVATPSTAQDSNFRITGTITIGNPNNVAVPVTVTDDLDIEDATCAINDADGAVVPASGTLTLTYECQLPDGTSPTTVGKNNATVTWNGGHITATTRYAFSSEAATVTDRTVQLSDTAPEFGSTRTLDALDGPQTFTYSRTLGETVTADTCQTFPNTASIAPTTDQPELTDDADVTVCAEPAVLAETEDDDDGDDDAAQLAHTGAETDGMLGVAGLAVTCGAVLLWLSRTRRSLR